MDESEFVVVEEGHNEEVKVAISDLKEAEQAYRAAHDALVKSNILLQDTLSLTLELALKKITPDFASDTDEITKKINESLYSSTEAVLRDHVKSLCSKLVAVNDEYEKLAKKFKAFKPPESFEPMPHLERLATILDQIDELLPNEGTPAEAPSTDIEKLCARAESIRDRVGLALEASGDKQLDTKPEVIRNVFEEPRAPLSESESQMSISRMIREEVTSVLQVEMANILDQQRDLIQQAIKPLAEENQADRKPSGSQGQPLQNSASAAAYPEFSSSSDTPLRESQLQQPTALPLEHSFHNSPSFLPEEETPVCPSCSLRCSDRFMLELHLDQCLK
uniref:UBZ4-type domain-containing protein n=2 Tax=Mesocestoides corti TaxID=53468 RepID=A0A5K3FR70_MESCO